MNETIAVTSINGAQGTAIADAFLAAGYKVRGIGRSRPNGHPNIDIRIGDLGDDSSLTAAFEGVDVVVFTSPIAHQPGVREAIARNVMSAAEAAGVSRVVLNTAAPVLEDSPKPIGRVLREVRQIVLGGAVPSVVLQPSVYMDNTRAPWFLPALLGDGVLAYPAAADTAVSWMSHRTLGELAVAAANVTGIEGSLHVVGGPEALTGTELARRIGRHIGREIQYVQIPFDDFAAGINAGFGAPAGDDIADMYRYVDRHRSALTLRPDTAAALGVQAESIEAFLERHRWTLD
jgi:NAD(P)H dehydrogenase (quinone)